MTGATHTVLTKPNKIYELSSIEKRPMNTKQILQRKYHPLEMEGDID